MPHIRIEFTEDLQHSVFFDQLMEDLSETLTVFQDVKKENIKVYAFPTEKTNIAGKDGRNFIHITLKLMEGRAPEVREQMANALLDKTASHFRNNNINISVHVVELTKENYFKKG